MAGPDSAVANEQESDGFTLDEFAVLRREVVPREGYAFVPAIGSFEQPYLDENELEDFDAAAERVISRLAALGRAYYGDEEAAMRETLQLYERESTKPAADNTGASVEAESP